MDRMSRLIWQRAVPFVTIGLAFAAPAHPQTPAGGEFRVNTYTSGEQTLGRVAMEPDGDFVIVWTSAQDGSSYGAFGRRYAASGAPRGGEFRINDHTTGVQKLPAAAVGKRGDFVVAWESEQDGSRTSIHARRYDPSGTPIGGEFQVNTFTPNYQYEPSIGRASDGSFVVIWSSRGVDDPLYFGMAGRRFDAAGSALGPEFLINTYTTGGQFFGDISMEADGDFVVVWEDAYNDRDGDGSAIFGQRFDAAGNRVGGEFRANAFTTGNQRLPSVSVSPPGGFVVSWASADGDQYGVFLRRFDAAGNAIGNEFVVNTSNVGNQYGRFRGVAHDALGNFVVTWTGPGDGSGAASFAQRFDASGARRGPEIQVNTYTTNLQRLPMVASDAVGNFIVDWDSIGQDGSATGVFAQRFGGLGPAALDVDTTGNRVLDPGETVDIRPTWGNLNGAAQTFGGALSGMTGPAGASYSIVDASANYGTVANDTSAQCVDCYSVSVSAPPTRPVLHWDASVVESLLPDTHGQQKRWTLHVGRSFTDVPSTSPFYRFVETLLHHGVTSGCTPTQYCPASVTTRDQMAVFVLVAKEGGGYAPPVCTTPMFADVPASSPYCRWIEELARRGVVGGCGGGNYCPASAVTREQMAVFVLRTLDPALVPPACGTPIYDDVPASSAFCRWIEELSRRAVVSGCGGGNYCPAASVTRDQMGVFMGVTFGLTLYGL